MRTLLSHILTVTSRQSMRALMLASCLALTLFPAVAHAVVTPPPAAPKLRSGSPVWIGYLVIGVLLVLVMVVALRPSKRGHQD